MLITGLIVGFCFAWAIVGLFIMLAAWLKYKYEFVTLDEHSITVHKGWLTKQTTEIPYSKINSVSLTGGRGRVGNIAISTSNDISKLQLVSIENAKELKESLQQRIGERGVKPPSQPSVAIKPSTDSRVERLERLAKLKAQGIVTTQEFQAEKKRILNS